MTLTEAKVTLLAGTKGSEVVHHTFADQLDSFTLQAISMATVALQVVAFVLFGRQDTWELPRLVAK